MEGALHWHEADTAQLQPTNLPIPKVHRAWDRKALSPFARRKTRRGGIAKAGNAILRASHSAKTVRESAHGSSASPMKPVKKLCMESSFGVAPSVSKWEGRGSPERKIVTRAGAEGQELVALDEEPDDVEATEGDVTIEIVEEDGTTRLVDVEEAELDQSWEDEEDEVPEKAEEDEEVFDDTMMHLVDVPEHTIAMESDLHGSKEDLGSEQPSEDTSTQELDPSILPDSKQDVASLLDPYVDISRESAAITIPGPSIQAFTRTELPEGFVSPVKQRRKLGPRSLKPQRDGRRQTLPIQFAPLALSPAAGMTQELDEVVREASSPLNTEQDPLTSLDNESDWEDVQAVEAPVSAQEALSTTCMHETLAEGFEVVPAVLNDKASSGSPHRSLDAPEATEELLGPDLGVVALRFSPRSQRSQHRKSSSPLKRSKVAGMDRPHHVAFTPLKLPRSWLEQNINAVPESPAVCEESSPRAPSDQRQSDVDHMHLDVPAVLERSTSAPPEEAKMSPQKPVKPRLSDDTALLQSFLKRAEESKNSRRLSVSDKESLTNRRDSDTVRRALASPAKLDVLADLDPNSPSVRGPSSSVDRGETSPGVTVATEKETAPAQEDVPASAQIMRRSGRGRQKPQVLAPMTYSAPSKISIRGNANVDLKRSEAQEKAILTKTNTRKNKFGSVGRKVRLTQLTAENTANESIQIAVADPSTKIRWAETLAVYSEAPEPDYSQLSDESSELVNSAPVDETPLNMGDDDDTASIPIAPVDTPSKPKAKQRRLPPRNASTTADGSVTIAPTENIEEPASTTRDEVPAVASRSKRATAQKQSRIATPAKALKGTNSLLPASEDVVATGPAERKTAVPKKKAVSKLPAPSSSSLVVTGDKENAGSLTLASPAKKKSAPAGAAASSRTVPTAKSFAPKLDFGSSLRLDAPSPDLGVAGLMSPAKKSRGRSSVFAANALERVSAEIGESEQGSRMGLTSSPAKKRSRR